MHRSIGIIVFTAILLVGCNQTAWDALPLPPLATSSPETTQAGTSPSAPTPAQPTDIRVTFPMAGARVVNPLVITGEAKGSWFFEANFSAQLVDANDTALGQAVLQATGDWMTEDFVPFRGSLSFEKPLTDSGTLILMSANPSGLPEHQKELRIPIRF